jgi:hypothetical protein
MIQMNSSFTPSKENPHDKSGQVTNQRIASIDILLALTMVL